MAIKLNFLSKKKKSDYSITTKLYFSIIAKLYISSNHYFLVTTNYYNYYKNKEKVMNSN